VNNRQYGAVFAAGKQKDGHGFDLVDADERRASNGAAGYYSFSPRRGMRMIEIDTAAQGGSFLLGPGDNSIATTDRGNLDDPQFRWLKRELKRARERNELVIVFSHHGVGTMDFNLADEAVEPCTGGGDEHKVAGVRHDRNPGCDQDPRSSTPIHLGKDLKALLLQYPNVIAHVAGHRHVNEITPIRSSGGRRGYWEVQSPAVADWPSVQRLIEVMDNRDGSLSIFGTIIDEAAPARAASGCPGPSSAGCPAVGSFGVPTMASIARTIAYNDPQVGPEPDQGTRLDRNVELLIADPRTRSSGDDDKSDGSRPPGGNGSDGSDGSGGARDNTGGGGSAGDSAGGNPAGAREGGSLPFTGFVVLTVALLGAAMLGGGRLLRRRLR
jgi:hypothetical protein